jgi:hypothetical protein
VFVSDWCTVLWAQCAGSVPAATTHCRLLTLTRHPCSRPTLRSPPGHHCEGTKRRPRDVPCTSRGGSTFALRRSMSHPAPRCFHLPTHTTLRPADHNLHPCTIQFAKRQRPLLQKEQRVISSNRKKPRAPTLSHVRWEARLRPQRDTAAVTLVTYATASADAPVYTQKECRVCSRVGSRHAP